MPVVVSDAGESNKKRNESVIGASLSMGTDMGENRRTPKKGSSSELDQNLYRQPHTGQTIGKTRANKRVILAGGGFPAVLSLAEQLPFPDTLGELDADGLVNQFGESQIQLGYSASTVSHSRSVMRTLISVAVNRLNRVPTATNELLDRGTLEATVERLRETRSADRRLPILDRAVEFLHTGEVTGRTAIPECELVKNIRRPAVTEGRQRRPYYRVRLTPSVDHPFAFEFIDYLNKKNKRWQKSAKYSLRQFCTWLSGQCSEFMGSEPCRVDIAKVKEGHIQSFREYLESNGLATGTVSLRIRALRRWFKFLYVSRTIPRDPTVRLKGVREERRVTRRILADNEVEQFLERVCRNSNTPLRDLPLYGCMASLGLRPSEAVNLRVEDVNFTNATLRVLGKWNKERLLPLPGPLLLDIERYLKSREGTFAGDSPLWINRSGTGLSYETVRKRFHHFKGLADIRRNVGGPHVFRHFFVTDSLQAGYDLEDIQAIKGDSNLRALDAYDHTTDEQARAAFFRVMKNNEGGRLV